MRALTHRSPRSATRDIILPVEYPLVSAHGTETRAVRVPAGTNVVVSILGANHNTAVWGADAAVWRPERWFGRVDLSAGKSLDLSFADADPGVDGEGEVDGQGRGKKAGVRYPGVYASM